MQKYRGLTLFPGVRVISPQKNDAYKPLGGLRLKNPPIHIINNLEARLNALGTLPPIMYAAPTIYNERDAMIVYAFQIGHRCQAILNAIYPQIEVTFQTEWSYFDGIHVDACVDLLWRVEVGGVYHKLGFTEFKRPNSIRLAEWEEGVGGTGELGDHAAEQSQQLTRYHHYLKTRKSQFTDLVNTIQIDLVGDPSRLQKAAGGGDYAMASVWFTRNSTAPGGDSLVQSTLIFLHECLGDGGWI